MNKIYETRVFFCHEHISLSFLLKIGTDTFSTYEVIFGMKRVFFDEKFQYINFHHVKSMSSRSENASSHCRSSSNSACLK